MKSTFEARLFQLFEVVIIGRSEMSEVQIDTVHLVLGCFIDDPEEVDFARVERVAVRERLKTKFDHGDSFLCWTMGWIEN